MTDASFYDLAREMEEQIALGGTCFQRFSCLACGARETMAVPNVLYKLGQCQECGFITNLEKTGCGFMLVASSDPEFTEAVQEIIESVQPRNRN
jgi:hypothetical protein